MKLKLIAAFAVMIAFIAAPFAASAQPILNPDSSLSGDDPDGTLSGFGDAFGAGAATWGDWLFVGTPRETTFRDGDDYQDGAVYIYKKDGGGTFVFEQKLTMPGSSGLLAGAFPVGDRFGGGIEAEAGWLFVGTANDQDFPGLVDPRAQSQDPADPDFQFAGQVHVYELNGSTWDFVQTLTSPAPGTNGSFGTRSQASHIALKSDAKVAVIGELNNFAGGVGQLHTYRFKKGSWQYVETINSPSTAIDNFGDDLAFVSNKYLVVGGSDNSDDELTVQGFVLVYQAKGASGKFFSTPEQTIAGPVTTLADCPGAPPNSFGASGLAAGGGVVAIGDPCATGAAGVLAGAVSVYRLVGGPLPLAFEATIEGDEPNLFFGSNGFGARHAVAVNDSGGRILIGTPRSPGGGLIDEGADVRVYADGPGGWLEESNLTTPTPATGDFRSFGDTVFFVDDETAFVREGNFLSPIVTGLKSQGFFYDLTP